VVFNFLKVSSNNLAYSQHPETFKQSTNLRASKALQSGKHGQEAGSSAKLGKKAGAPPIVFFAGLKNYL
jgi:hypothetical protein